MDDERTGPFVIGFNGPPRSGKDTIATALMDLLDREGVTSLPVHRQALAATMREGAASILGRTLTDKQYGEIKDEPMELLGGKTFRRFMIDMSEVFVKGTYGQDFWGRLLHQRNKVWWETIPSILIITDIGFSAEVEYLCKRSRLFLNVRVDRPNCDFSKDSRGYVSSASHGGVDFALTNDSTIEHAAQEVARIMYKFGVPVF